ncbi:GGDEF domain-containing protein [Pectinatus frisingensis]|uniref:GGDEF domain-containing protein n=1 Tax=Pectinatus frisingensis TaxID=865 RepID=UPI0018C57712|nr:GGDEF domain-containing protein [Pectinatus frisingensis]
MDEGRELKKILCNKLITPVYQPIVNLRTGMIFAYEALSRGPEGSSLYHPDKLFAAAKMEKCLWQLDYLCRSMAISHAEKSINDRELFLNVDAKILYDNNFHQGTTARFLKQCNLNTKNIVFEISEKTAVDDYEIFRSVLKNYQCQNYQIAIDDFGAGYSGLNLLVQISPQFIKLDIGLISNIDKNYVQRSVVKALVDFAHAANIKIIAEGIERKEELELLIELGIDYGQGFFLAKPKPRLEEISDCVVGQIKKAYENKEIISMNTLLNITIGKIIIRQDTFSSDTPGYIILEYLKSLKEPLDVIIVDETVPVGILNHNIFYQQLATAYGMSLYCNRPIRLIMDKNPLVVDYETSIEEVAQKALNRQARYMYDSIIVVRDGKYYGTVTIKKLLEITTKVKLNSARHASPLTGLPGNDAIEWNLIHCLKKDMPFGVIYVDIDNFKSYNDSYGFEAGDKVLVAAAKLLNETLCKYADKFFLGHIGGDDFIAIISVDKITTVCQMIIDSFDCKTKKFYSPEDQANKYIMAHDRKENMQRYPLMTVSLAVIRINKKAGITLTNLASRAAVIKKKCKAVTVSNFIVDVYSGE